MSPINSARDPLKEKNETYSTHSQKKKKKKKKKEKKKKPKCKR